MLKNFSISQILPIILLFILGVTPLIEAQNKLGYEHPKVLFFICSVLLMLILFEFSPKQKGTNIFPKSPITIYGSLFIVAISLVSFFRPQFPQNLFGFYPYYQGVILYFFLFLFALLVSKIQLPFKKYCNIIAISSSVIALVAIGHWVGIHILNLPIATYSGRVVSTFGQPNLYSGYLAMALPLVLLLLEKAQGKKKALFVGIASIIVLGIMISMSRITLVMLFVLGIAIAIFFLRRSRYFKKIIIGIGVIILLFGSFTLPKLIQKELIDPFTGVSYIKNEPDKRIFIWQVAVLQGIKQPLFGYGMDSFRDVYSSYFSDAKRNDSYHGRRDLVVDRAHNYILDLFVYAGIVGVTLWILLVKSMFAGLRNQRYLSLSLVLYILFVLFHPQSIIHLIYFWFLAGLSTKPSDYFK